MSGLRINGLPIMFNPYIEDGSVMMSRDPYCCYIGTMSGEADKIVRAIVIDVFGEAFLKSIGAYPWTGQQLYDDLKMGPGSNFDPEALPF